VSVPFPWHDDRVVTTRLVGLDEIEDARRRLEGVAVRTPLDRSRALSAAVDGEVFVKCENLQRTGSFKIRGAFNRISRLSDDERRAGVVAASAGNHAQGVALAASLTEVPSTVFMPEAAPLPKVEATQRYGAKTVLVGKDFGEAFDAAMQFVEESGATFVHPFDHEHVIAGQGTIGCEIVESVPDVGTVVVPVGGGGLISGVSAALRALRPEVRIIGVQAKGAPCFIESLRQGSKVTIENMLTIADGIAANTPGDLTLEHVRRYVDDVVPVTDDAMAHALVFALERMKLVLEPSGAAGIAALLTGDIQVEPPVVVILSGGNIDPMLLHNLIRFGLSTAGRYLAFNTRMRDKPGELARLLSLIAEQGGNLIGVEHHREGLRLSVGEVEVALQVETKGPDHIGALIAALESGGYSVDRY
jgi:threonine dehydratase